MLGIYDHRYEREQLPKPTGPLLFRAIGIFSRTIQFGDRTNVRIDWWVRHHTADYHPYNKGYRDGGVDIDVEFLGSRDAEAPSCYDDLYRYIVGFVYHVATDNKISYQDNKIRSKSTQFTKFLTEQKCCEPIRDSMHYGGPIEIVGYRFHAYTYPGDVIATEVKREIILTVANYRDGGPLSATASVIQNYQGIHVYQHIDERDSDRVCHEQAQMLQQYCEMLTIAAAPASPKCYLIPARSQGTRA